MSSKWFAPIVIIGMLIFSAAIYSALPAQIPIHWDMAGNANRMSDKLFGVLLLPVISIAVSIVVPGARRLDPLRESYASFEDTYRFVINLVIAFLAFMHVMTLGLALGWDINIAQVVGIGIGLLFMLLGNVLGRVRPNWFMGIRTPWTLSDPEVWRLTHRVGGRIMFVAGLLVLITSLLLPTEWAIAAMLVGGVGASVVTLIYSYLTYRRLHSTA